MSWRCDVCNEKEDQNGDCQCDRNRQLPENIKASLVFFKGWIGRFLLDKRPMDVAPAEWVAWIEWNVPDIHHAIDHIIVDHCLEESP